MKFLNIFKRADTEKNANTSVSYFLTYGNNILFSQYDNPKLAIEGYMRNIVCYTAITTIVDELKRGKWQLFNKTNGALIEKSKVLDILRKPYPTLNKTSFLERIGSHTLIYGNRYIEKLFKIRGEAYKTEIPWGLFPLRPDFVTVYEGKNSIPSKYDYNSNQGESLTFPVSSIGKSNLIHGMLFNPSDDYHGLSPLIPAGYSIDTHNAVGKWNFKFLENGARPSGILTVPKEIQIGPDVEASLKKQLDEIHSGQENNGRPMLLKGGITWQQISTNPADGDFIEMKKQATHEIALAFRMPIELLNTEQAKYDNLHAAYEQVYNNKVLPIAESIEDDLNNDFVPLIDENAILKLDYSHTKTMQDSKLRLMEKLNPIDFMTYNEKRSKLDMEPIDNGDELPQKQKPITQDMNKYISKEMADGLTYEEARAQAELIF